MTIFESSKFKKNLNRCYGQFRLYPPALYEFPNNLNSVFIKETINRWTNFIKNQKVYQSYESYYNEFLIILSNINLSKSFNTKFHNIDKDAYNLTNAELQRVMNSGTIDICNTYEKYDDIEKEIIKNGDCKINVV